MDALTEPEKLEATTALRDHILVAQNVSPNAVLSMLDWALQTYGNNKPQFSIHADNCPGN